MTTYDILQDECVQDILRMKEREELLSKYDRKIWQGKNGKWYTYLPSDNGGRKQIKRNSKKDIEDIVVQFEKSQINNPMVSEIFEEWNNRRLELERISKSPHKIRKTYGTILLDSGVDNRLILDQMGHASIGTTERHYHRNRRNIDAKQNILNRIDDLAIAK